MEVASAGDYVADLLKLGIEMACTFAPRTRGWEPFFAGYGGEPHLALFRLRLHGWSEASFRAHGSGRWPANRALTLGRLLTTETWEELFRT